MGLLVFWLSGTFTITTDRSQIITIGVEDHDTVISNIGNVVIPVRTLHESPGGGHIAFQLRRIFLQGQDRFKYCSGFLWLSLFCQLQMFRQGSFKRNYPEVYEV